MENERKPSRTPYILHIVFGAVNIVPVVIMLFSWQPGDQMGLGISKGFSLMTKLLVLGLVLIAGIVDIILAATKKLSGRTALFCFLIYAGMTGMWILSTKLVFFILGQL